MYVWRTLDSTLTMSDGPLRFDLLLAFGFGEWEMMPAPNLLAEPSRPRQMYGRSVGVAHA